MVPLTLRLPGKYFSKLRKKTALLEDFQLKCSLKVAKNAIRTNQLVGIENERLVKGALSFLGQNMTTKSPFKMMKNAVLFLRFLHFCADNVVTQKNSLLRKPKLILKLMTSQARQKVITIHIFPNNSKLKGNTTLFLLYINEFLMMLSVILLSTLMIVLFTLSVIRHLICGNNCN